MPDNGGSTTCQARQTLPLNLSPSLPMDAGSDGRALRKGDQTQEEVDMTSVLPQNGPGAARRRREEPGRTPPAPPSAGTGRQFLRWLPWLVLVLLAATLTAALTRGGDDVAAPTAVNAEPYEAPGVISRSNLPGHVLEAITLGEIGADADTELLTTTNPPAHLLEERAVSGASS